MFARQMIWAVLVLGVLAWCVPAVADDLKGLKKDFRKALAGENPEEAQSIMQEIASIGTEDSWDEVFTIALQYANTPEFYEACLTALRGMDNRYEFFTTKVEKSRKFPEKVLVCDVLKGDQTAEAVNVMLPMIEDKNQFVTISCVQSLEKSMRREAVGPLISLYAELTKKKSKDVLYYQVGDTLFNLTGHDFELIEDWNKWWEPIAETFDPKETSTGGDTGVKRKRREKNPEFLGVPVESKNVCFVIDTSGGMMIYVAQDIDIPGLGSSDGADGGGNRKEGGGVTPENKILADFWTRIEMAKRALFMCLWEMDKSTSFNVVTFDTKAELLSKKSALKANAGGKKKAEKWLQDQISAKKNKVRGGAKLHTNTMEALTYAFNTDPKINTIFFLSDGVPSKDGLNMDPTGPILDKVFEMNKYRKIKIHTFGFNPRKNSQDNPQMVTANEWLEKLAKKTGGTFTMLKVDRQYTPDDPYGRKGKRRKNELPAVPVDINQ